MYIFFFNTLVVKAAALTTQCWGKHCSVIERQDGFPKAITA